MESSDQDAMSSPNKLDLVIMIFGGISSRCGKTKLTLPFCSRPRLKELSGNMFKIWVEIGHFSCIFRIQLPTILSWHQIRRVSTNATTFQTIVVEPTAQW